MQWLDERQGEQWSGTGELWIDPEGNVVDECTCALAFELDRVTYHWSYKGQSQTGSFVFEPDGVGWSDTWHQPDAVACETVPGSWALFCVHCCYGVSDGPPWGWCSQLSQRPNGDLVLQMTNIAPWGEEGRAVRMVFSRAET